MNTTRQPPAIAVIYQDRSLLVVEKPGGLLSVPGRGPTKQDCLVNRLRKQFPDLPPQPAVHRLDLHTSGLMILARTETAHSELSKQFQNRQVEKQYEAIIEGDVTDGSGTIELAFRLDPDNRPLQIYDPIHGKKSITKWRKLTRERRGTRIEFTPLTGRTHQIRLHAAHPRGLNAPIVGDYLYGTGNDGDQMLLHATCLKFMHPRSGSPVVFSSTPPF
ncbi:MAG: RluA family pseudouridine synthase [Desulfobulbaceae bacterium]|nr:MAG: RluA family pseudouridine synthase [Desulfobulbaceae bacterium]